MIDYLELNNNRINYKKLRVLNYTVTASGVIKKDLVQLFTNIGTNSKPNFSDNHVRPIVAPTILNKLGRELFGLNYLNFD